MYHEEKYIRPKDKVEYTITQRGRLSLLHDEKTGGTNDFIGFMVEGGGKTHIPVTVAIAPALPYIWKLVATNDTDKEEIEVKLRKLFFLQLKKTIKEDPEKLQRYHFLFKTNVIRNKDGKEEVTTNFSEYADTYEKTIENFEKELAK